MKSCHLTTMSSMKFESTYFFLLISMIFFLKMFFFVFSDFFLMFYFVTTATQASDENPNFVFLSRIKNAANENSPSMHRSKLYNVIPNNVTYLLLYIIYICILILINFKVSQQIFHSYMFYKVLLTT